MRKIRLHARAERDLIDIWVYSFEEWEDVQADRYLEGFMEDKAIIERPHWTESRRAKAAAQSVLMGLRAKVVHGLCESDSGIGRERRQQIGNRPVVGDLINDAMHSQCLDGPARHQP
jgi:hypothetical protein